MLASTAWAVGGDMRLENRTDQGLEEKHLSDLQKKGSAVFLHSVF